MARKWKVGNGIYAWNFNECEEVVLIAGFEKIHPFITPGETWPIEFEHRYFVSGEGVNFKVIDEINAVRRRRSVPILEFRETEMGEYGLSVEKAMKAKYRASARQELIDADAARREIIVNYACAEMQTLAPSRFTYEEAQEGREKRQAQLKEWGVTNRMTALRRSVQRPARIDLEVARRMLPLATDHDLRAEIVAAMSGSDALAAAETTDDQETRDMLLRHAVSAIVGS